MKHQILSSAKAVIFDFDGTLAVLNIDFSSMRNRIFELMGRYDIKKETVHEKYLLEMIDEIHMILFKKNPSEAGIFYQDSHRILHILEMRAAEKGRLFPGIRTTLESLQKEGVKVGIITRNCEEAVRTIFPDMDRYCDQFISRDSVKNVKPHPDHLIQVMESLKSSAEESIMIGDHLIDIQAGKRVGMRTIGVLTGRTSKEEFEKAGADYILKDVTEIHRLLEDKNKG